MQKSKVQSWNVVSGYVSIVFVLIALHFLDNVWVVVAAAFLLQFVISAIRFPLFWVFVTLGRMLDHEPFLTIWALATGVYFLCRGQWLAGLTAPLYCFLLGPIFQLPSVFVWDKVLGRPDARIYAYFKLKSRATGQEMPRRDEMLQAFRDEPITDEKEDILIWMRRPDMM